MKITRRQKIGIGVLGLALAGLALDRVVSGSSAGPAETPAADLLVTPAGSAGAAPAALPIKGTLKGMQALARRLEAAGTAAGIRVSDVGDVFRPSTLWTAGRGADGKATPQTFASRHKLSAVLRGTKDASVIIDGRCLTVGQRLDGFKLVAIGQRSAVLEGEGEQVQLWIADGSEVTAGADNKQSATAEPVIKRFD